MTHGRAVAVMIAATLMWSIAGVVTRFLDSAASFEVTFWRSFFNMLALTALLLWLRGPPALMATLRHGGRALWLSGLCWTVMFTAFMVAITLTTVANVLVTMASAPLFAALMARFALGHRIAARTWAAIALAGVGIGWMYAREVGGGDARTVLGTLVALMVPIAAAVNWTLLQAESQRVRRGEGKPVDLLPAVLIGAALSSLCTLPFSLPFAASGHDLGLLALLGVVQLAIPCLMSVRVARVLPAPEMSLLGLLEVVFGVAWAWLGANEAPSVHVLLGGALVLVALAGNELLALRKPRPAAP